MLLILELVGQIPTDEPSVVSFSVTGHLTIVTGSKVRTYTLEDETLVKRPGEADVDFCTDILGVV